MLFQIVLVHQKYSLYLIKNIIIKDKNKIIYELKNTISPYAGIIQIRPMGFISATRSGLMRAPLTMYVLLFFLNYTIRILYDGYEFPTFFYTFMEK